MTERARDTYKYWLNQNLEDIELTKELEAISQDAKAIEERFYKDLEFGTGGLRGIMGAGTNRMNVYTVARATQGYCSYLKKIYSGEIHVSIAFDSRLNSVNFARTAGEVFAANGIIVHIYPELMPTPSLSFAIRQLHCNGGIVITASHNPSEYNGYKVYGKDGCQITTGTAKEIQKEISRVDMFADVAWMSFEKAQAEGLVVYIGKETVDAFIQAVSEQALCDAGMKKDISIVYTPLNGAGGYCVKRVLKENGFQNVYAVKEQEMPDGCFPTCPYPNPEIEQAMELGIRDAKRLNCDLLLATDPDCDRVGVGVKSGCKYLLLSANEIGMLLLEYICKQRNAGGSMPCRPLMMKTIVTIDMAERIASEYGVDTVNVLTGFKYIGEQIGLLEEKGEEERFIFGFEESYGYLSGSYVRDKDGVGASLLISEMAAYYKNQGKGLKEVLDELYAKYGYCLNTLHCYTFEGMEGIKKMDGIMSGFRTAAPSQIGGLKVISISDYKESLIKYRDGRENQIELPKSNVMKFMLEGNASMVVRPSGTEPKLKLYFSICADTEADAKQLEMKIKEDIEKVLY